ncbi:MAG TPA: hypothetical protein VNQ32_15200 [Steroidobacteraceae bacterium]|nr:hypothetical protein [Steroidobacteraceae bacterium]
MKGEDITDLPPKYLPVFVIGEAIERIEDGAITQYVCDPKAAWLVQAGDFKA